jgi:molybdate transport system substrate-binding protein
MIRTRLCTLLVAIAILLTAAGCSGQSYGASSGPKTELLLSAAASLTDSLNELKTIYEKEHPGITLTFNFGASGALQQQIEQGAPADLFFSAGKKQMSALVDKKLIDAGKQKNILTNELVAIMAKDAKTQISKIEDLLLPQVKKVALGEPDIVPAGSYAKEALVYAKQFDALQPKIVYGKDVRQVLTYVETGNTDIGFVYKTDALTSQKVKVAFALNPQSYTPVQYPLGIVTATKHKQEAEALYAFVQTKKAQDLFIKHGFTIPK